MVRTRQQARTLEVEGARDKEPVHSNATKSSPASKPESKKSRSKDAGADRQPKKDHTLIHESSEQQSHSDVLNFAVPHKTSTIACDLRPALPTHKTTMIFTHGAGGTISTPAIANFAEGFASESSAQQKQINNGLEISSSITCFQGTMNLKSRTTMFHSVAEYLASNSEPLNAKIESPVFGGRSMGSRAAVIAANEVSSGSEGMVPVEKLVLVSYPLQGPKGELRDQILLDIDKSIEVLFIIGTKDNMCSLEQLDIVRHQMKARSWLLTIEGATHGMDCKEKKRTREMQMATGRVAAQWISGHNLKSMAGTVDGTEGYEMRVDLPIQGAKRDLPNSTGTSGKENAIPKRRYVEDDETIQATSNKKTRRQKRE